MYTTNFRNIYGYKGGNKIKNKIIYKFALYVYLSIICAYTLRTYTLVAGALAIKSNLCQKQYFLHHFRFYYCLECSLIVPTLYIAAIKIHLNTLGAEGDTQQLIILHLEQFSRYIRVISVILMLYFLKL